MRLLLDECVDEDLRHKIAGHECHTARYAQLTGLGDDQLLKAAEDRGFDVLITVDQNIPFQQQFRGRRIAIVVLCGRFARLEDLESLLPYLSNALETIGPGEVLRISH